MKRIIFFLIFLLTFKLLAASNPDIHQVLQQAYNRGEITKAQELYYRLASLYDRELVPESYQNYIHAVSRMGTSLKLEAFFEMPNMTQAERANFEIFFQRPSQSFLEKSLISPYGLFEIHYTSLGQHAATDDFIQQVAEAFDHVYDVEINTLGYNPPPIDDIASPEYDVYVYDINGYGATTPENSVPSTGRDDYTSWIEIDNDFSEVSTTGIPGMLVTAAHEFFHMIHLGYRGYSGTLMNPIFYMKCLPPGWKISYMMI